MEKIFETFRVKPGKKITLDKWGTKENSGITKEETLADMDLFKEQLQERLYAIKQVIRGITCDQARRCPTTAFPFR